MNKPPNKPDGTEQKLISLIRVSTAEQAGEWKSGVTRQQEWNNGSAKAVGIPIAYEAVVKDVSGRHVKYDPQFQKLFRDLARPDIAGVIVTELSRLIRPDEFDYSIFQKFADTNTKIWVKSSPIDPTSPEGRMALVMGGLMAGEELRTIRSRMMDGKRKARLQGRHVTGGKNTLPLGVTYTKHRDASGKVTGFTWGLDPVESDRVKRAFDLLLEGYSYDRIAEMVGRVSTSGAMRVSLQNPIWIGKRAYIYRASDEEHMAPGATKPTRRSVLREDPVTVDIDIPHLVSDEVFYRAQEIITERSTRWRKTKLKYSDRPKPILSGVGRCVCGESLYYSYSHGKVEYDRYYCGSKYHPSRKFCGAPTVRSSGVDKAVHELVRELGDPEFIRQNAARVVARTKTDPRKTARDKAVNNLAAQTTRIKDMYQRGDLTRGEYQDRLKRVQSERLALENESPTELPQGVTEEQIARKFHRAIMEFELMSWDEQRTGS